MVLERAATVSGSNGRKSYCAPALSKRGQVFLPVPLRTRVLSLSLSASGQQRRDHQRNDRQQLEQNI